MEPPGTEPQPCTDPSCRGQHAPAERGALAVSLCAARGNKLTPLRRHVLELLWERADRRAPARTSRTAWSCTPSPERQSPSASGHRIAHRAIVHGPRSVGDGAFIGFNSVLFDCAVGEGCVVGHNAVVDGCDLPAGLHAPSAQCVGPHTDVATMPRVTADGSAFSDDVVRNNNALVLGYKRLDGEL